ncbi:alanine dehydrogenase [Muricomes intestini]|uniref:Alanine dehydrogenase n=1 Tax=Muricomes intestini TaxID=1796634 RepID=A0A4R3KGT8_9FIRM|nr:alanine dehydrogenase [Muricomes intestini]TCS82239.1 alanine dehydrogenase [Muricomes intestini]HCR84743.1 alanine dehydrogenase [Lachnospiraceae bacterium]
MKVGCVKEIKKYEYRVGLTPENVKEYVNRKNQVYIQKGAGEGAFFTDEMYREAGAVILDTAEEIWAECDMIVKVKEPLEEEYDLIRENQIIYTYLHLAADRPLTDALLKSKAKAVAYETIRDKNGGLPLLKPMSEVAGRLSIQEGARCLERTMGGMGLLLGGVSGVRQANVLIIGAGVVGTNACKMAVGLGARVTIADNNIDRLTYLDDMFGSRIQTMYSTDSALEKACCEADLVIGSVLIPGAKAPKLIKERYLDGMKNGSVIVDVAVDQGGCCETTVPTYHDNPTFIKKGVVHYCVANMPGAVAMTSTMALTNATLRYGLAIADVGVEEAIRRDGLLALGMNCYEGKLTCKEVAEAHDMEYTDIFELI